MQYVTNSGKLFDPEDAILTEEEHAVLQKLADAWNLYIQLPDQHPRHKMEAERAMHELQRLVMSRPTARIEGWVKDNRVYYPLEQESFRQRVLNDWPELANAIPIQASMKFPLPTPDEKEIMVKDGYGVVEGNNQYGSVFPGHVQSPHLYDTSDDAWREARMDWFARFELPRRAVKASRNG